MSLQLYRIEHQGQVTYAVLQEDRFYFVDPKNSQQPITKDQSAPSSECRILVPTTPSKIIGVGLNYRDHAMERNKPIPEEPLLFLKPPSSLSAMNDPIILPPSSKRVDPEVSLLLLSELLLRDSKQIKKRKHAFLVMPASMMLRPEICKIVMCNLPVQKDLILLHVMVPVFQLESIPVI